MYCPRKCKRLKGHSLIEGNMACCSGRADIWGRGYASQLCPECENRQEVMIIWQEVYDPIVQRLWNFQCLSLCIVPEGHTN